ncbi:ATP-binding protein [Streptomyces sp. P1-3]|uniref:ATP-binding protein n=1 Tax=Streptomyces sp. P1-3 TaxID=3421658 RepID=UPI003D3628E4
MRAVPDQTRERWTDGVEARPIAAAVVSDRHLSFTVDAVEASVPVARCEVAAHLAMWGLPRGLAVVDTALIAVSELVTNSVQHAADASPTADVALALGGGELSVAVHDRDPQLPQTVEVPHLDGSGGWGLRLVEALAAEAGGRVTPPWTVTGLARPSPSCCPYQHVGRQRHVPPWRRCPPSRTPDTGCAVGAVPSLRRRRRPRPAASPRRGRPRTRHALTSRSAATGLTPGEEVPEPLPQQLPFSIVFDTAKQELVLWTTHGVPPRQTTRRKAIPTPVDLVIAVAEHRHEAYLQTRLAQHLAGAAVQHLGLDPDRLETAVRSLADPTRKVPLETLLHGTPPPGTVPAGARPTHTDPGPAAGGRPPGEPGRSATHRGSASGPASTSA